jgi:signal transduction histidine kinase/HAMP domain-containing protein
MSQTNKYKRLEALFSERKPAAADPISQPAIAEVDALKARLASLEAELGRKSRETSIPGSVLQKEYGSAMEKVTPEPAKHPEEGPSQQGRNVSRLAITFTIAALFATAIFAFLAIQTGSWHAYVVTAAFFGFFIIQARVAHLARKDRIQTAGFLLIGAVCYIVIAMTSMMAGIGLALSIALALVIIEISSDTLSGPLAWRASLFGIAFSTSAYLFDQFAFWNRLSSPVVQYAIPIIAAGTVITIAFLMISRIRFWNRAMANVAMGWKMAFIVFVFVLGMAGVITIGVRSLQRLQFHTSNLYEFMLVPIITLEDADVRLAESSFHIHVLSEDLNSLSNAEREAHIEAIRGGVLGLKTVLNRYQSEWITTSSPEFTELLRSQGQLALQQQEVTSYNETSAALGKYEADMLAFLQSVDDGQPNELLAERALNTLTTLIASNRKLIETNHTFARISFEVAGNDYNSALLNGSITVMLALIASLFISILIVTSITNRLGELTRSASSVEQGNFDQTVTLAGNDEVGLLGSVFNRMTVQLRGLVGSLEQRVTDRTHDLELASEVGRTITGRVTDLSEMLSEAVETIRSRFELYYTQVYLIDPSGRNLVLRAGTGDAGSQLLRRGHRLAIASTSLNGRAASDRQPVLVTDTTTNANFLPNPLLPLTRSELAVPLIANDRVVGVLDMQSERSGTFREGNLPAFQVLAGQLAIAIQNASLFDQAEQARKQVQEQSRLLTATGWQGFLNGVERSENIGYVFDQNIVHQLNGTPLSSFESELSIPIQITGAHVGQVTLADEGQREWTEDEKEIVQATVERVAQHIENLRLLNQAEQFRFEAEQVSRRLTREGWQEYLRGREELGSGYTFTGSKVQPLNGHGHEEVRSYPLVIRDEAIGEFLLEKAGTSDEYDNQIISAVVEQLSDHIENLRLLEQAEQKRIELETVATVSSTASTVLDPDKLLQSVVDLTKERFGLYHAHIYLANQSWSTLLLAAGAGEVGRKLVANEHTIPMDAERSLVARAARESKAVIVNDVRSEADFLPNPLLPETRAEMAVPMIVGENVLGVFDVQSNKTSGFTKEDADIYTTLAAQVAVALQNARLYVEQAATVTQLRELDRLKSSFLANMSHELRTPLNSILGFADVMLEELDGPITDTMENDLGLIQKNGQHLLHLINDVLDMAKIEAGRMNLLPEKFKVHEILNEVISITSNLAGEKNLALFVESSSDEHIEITADRTRLRQVMINLVNNSVKFTEQGGISIRALLDNENVVIAVKDSGIGIPPEHLEAVFQEFTQVDTSTTRKAGGTGLGLPISRRLIEMHGGRIWAESTGLHGEGSTFYVSLPIEAKIVDQEQVFKN